MDRPTTGDALPGFARALATQIERRMEDLDAKLRGSGQTVHEVDAVLFTEFESFLTLALEDYRPEPARSRGIRRLVFQPLYDDALGKAVAGPSPATASSRNVTRPMLLSALMAAQVEALGPLRLTRNQSDRLAAVLFRLGDALDAVGLLEHAAAAYDRAARLYGDVDDDPARDRCLKQLASVRHRALPRGWRRVAEQLNATLFGYGFEPYRFLAWMGVQLAIACTILVMLPKGKGLHASVPATLYLALQDFVNPMGLGDTDGLSHWAWAVLVVESYFGLISSSIFFALLLRRWFRA
jgi:hypothetical protein